MKKAHYGTVIAIFIVFCIVVFFSVFKSRVEIKGRQIPNAPSAAQVPAFSATQTCVVSFEFNGKVWTTKPLKVPLELRLVNAPSSPVDAKETVMDFIFQLPSDKKEGVTAQEWVADDKVQEVSLTNVTWNEACGE